MPGRGCTLTILDQRRELWNHVTTEYHWEQKNADNATQRHSSPLHRLVHRSNIRTQMTSSAPKAIGVADLININATFKIGEDQVALSSGEQQNHRLVRCSGSYTNARGGE